MTTASIVTHRTDIAQLLTAVRCCAVSAIDRLIVVDNSPAPESAPDVRELRDAVSAVGSDMHVDVVSMDNRGFGAGHNLAVSLIEDSSTGSDFHLILNADVCWQGDVITPMVTFMTENPDVAMTAPRILYPDGMLQYNVRMLPTPADLLLKRFLPGRLLKKRQQRYLLAQADHHRAFNAPYLTGCFLLARTQTFLDAGGFDERYFMYPEDIDLTRRLHRRHRTMYWPEVTVTHNHAAASRRSWKMLRIHTTNMIRYFNKWGWLRDKERSAMNRALLSAITPARNPEQGRG